VRCGITLVIVEPIPVGLSGVAETLLGNLGRRAAAARMGALNDPVAIEVVDRLEYDSARGARLHSVRVSTFDETIRRFLGSYPAGTVVALGEELETQLARCRTRVSPLVRFALAWFPWTPTANVQVPGATANRRWRPGNCAFMRCG
jgi:hypothetical protein